MSINKVRFVNGRNMRETARAFWEADIEDGEERPPQFICAACGESKPFDELTLTMVVDDVSQKPVCSACERSFEPPSTARKIFR